MADQHRGRCAENPARAWEDAEEALSDGFAEAIPKIEDGVAAFKTACEAIDTGRTARSLASTELAAAEDTWAKLMEKTYGALVLKLDRKRADRFFPKIGSAKRASANESGPTGS